MIRLQRVPFIFFVINVVSTICCVWWVRFGYRDEQTIATFAIIEFGDWTEVLKFELVFLYGRGTC